MDVKISVVVPIYNMEKFILHAVTCLKEQDMEDVEFLLINDGSTDRTMEILTELVEGDSRFRILSIENHGYGYACNYGMKHARGVYTAIYEPDDSIDSDFYSTLYEYAERYPHADVIRYNGFYKNINGVKSRLYMWEEKYTDQILDKYQMKRFWRSHPSVYNGMYRTEFLRTKNVVFCESPGASFQDVTFMISLFYSNPSIYIINKLKYYYTIHDAQSTRDIFSKIDSVIMNWNKEYAWLIDKKIDNKSFFLYKICMQAYSICRNINDHNVKNKIYYEIKRFFNIKFLNCEVATCKEKIICILLFMKVFI